MSMSDSEKQKVKAVIADSLRNKFDNYEPKDMGKPFHTRLLGNDRMALFSFIQSLNTAVGTVIYEPVAETLAHAKFQEVYRGKESGGVISADAQDVINKIKNGLERMTVNPCQKSEVEQIRNVCQTGGKVDINLRRADIYLVGKGDWHYPIDIKTAKPNIDGVEKYKENMLKWTAAILYENPDANVGAMIGIPYNPSFPRPFKPWTFRGMIECGTQMKVDSDFWDFLAGRPVYENLLDCFEKVGIEMREEIDEYFARFQKT